MIKSGENMARFPGKAACTRSKYSPSLSHDIHMQLMLSDSQVRLKAQGILKLFILTFE